MNSSNHFVLGLFCIGVMGLLGFFTMGASDFTLFGDVQEIVVQFPEADGLREGDSVLIAGVRWGKVTTITYDPSEADYDRRITIGLSLDEPVEIREGHLFEIRDATLLGGKRLTIDPGPAGGSALDTTTTVFQGSVQLNVVEAAGELITSNSASITEAIDGIRDLVTGVQAGTGTVGKIFVDEEFATEVDRTVSGFADAGENLASLTDSLKRGEGTLGKLFTSDEMYVSLKKVSVDLQDLLAEANGAIADARAGKGTLGMLLTDEEVSSDVKEAMNSLRDIVGRANRGEGSLGKFLVEDSIATNIDTVIQRWVNGEGTLGALMAKDDVYESVDRITSDLADVVSTVREGRGTVGKLIMEEELYFELVKAVGLLTRSLEEYREAAPVSTMADVIFGAF
jgi:phospholipid/cholesterol/gamma-HCH transport system substrate-binding protein